MNARSLLPGALALLALSSTLAAQEPGEAAKAAREFSQRCVNCHFVPDPSLRPDRAWLAMVQTTS